MLMSTLLFPTDWLINPFFQTDTPAGSKCGRDWVCGRESRAKTKTVTSQTETLLQHLKNMPTPNITT
jgi:hypothetical protein